VAEIRVSQRADGEFEVVVVEKDGRTTHRVRVSRRERELYGAGTEPAALVEESFRFLLEREPKESILGSFDLSVIERYFPEYPDEIRRRLGRPVATS
jgi:hypothetical protein